MFRIDTPNAVAVKPAYAPIGVPGYFDDSDPEAVVDLSAEWFNHVQEELCALITGFGLTPDKADDNQIANAIVPRLTDACAWKTKIEVGDPFETGFYKVIATTEGGVLGPLFGYVETDKFFAREGVFTGTQAAPVQRIDSSGDCDFRNVVLSSSGVDGIVAVASTGRLATKGDVNAQGSAKFGASDLFGASPKALVDGANGNIGTKGGLNLGCTDPETGAGAKFAVDGSTGNATVSGKVSAAGGLAVGYDTDGNHDPATVDAPSGKVTEFWVGGSIWSAGTIQTQTVNCDKVGADSIVLVSVQASDGSPAVYRNLSCGVREQAAGSFTIWARNEGTDMTDPFISWRFVVINPV